jgi:K+-sensing histidine kinase KdpD
MLAVIKGVIALSVVFINLFVAFLGLIRNPRNLINKMFFVIGLVFAFWALSLFFYEFPFFLSSLFWIKATYLMVIFYIILLLLFSFIFPKSTFSEMRIYAVVVSAFYAGVSTWILFLTDLWVVGVTTDPVRGLQTQLGPVYIWWVVANWLLISWMMINFLLKYRYITKIQKMQMWYFWVGLIISCIGVCLFDVLIPLVWHDTRIFIFGTITNLFFMGAVAYSIFKFKLLDIRLVVARSIAHSSLLVVLGFIYSGGIFFISSFFYREKISAVVIITSAIISLIIAFSFQAFLPLIEKITDRFFYKGKYDSDKLLYDLTLIMASTLRLQEMASGLLNKILQTMHIDRGAFVLIDKKRIYHLTSEGYAKRPKFSEEDLEAFIAQSRIAIFDELPENSLKETMRRLEIGLIIPLRTQTEFEDVLILGEKLSGQPYTAQDIKLLEIFSSEVAITIANVSGFEKLLRLDELKSEFVTVVSHQLRTPLAAARWNFELLLEEAFGQLPDKINNVIKDIYQTLMALNKGLNNLMSVLEIEEGKVIIRRDEVEINQDIIDEAIKNLTKEIQDKNIIIKRRFSVKRNIFIDRQKITKIFEILIDNAVRYSPVGSTVTITTAWNKEEGKEDLLVSVEDEGIGVEAENRELVVQKFFRGEEAKKMSPSGFGLSLFAARSYIEFYGGRLWVENKKGPGSIFKFCFPLDEDTTKRGNKKIRIMSLGQKNN